MEHRCEKAASGPGLQVGLISMQPLIYTALGIHPARVLPQISALQSATASDIREFQLDKLNRLLRRIRGQPRPTGSSLSWLHSAPARFQSLEEFQSIAPIMEKSAITILDEHKSRRFRRDTAGSSGTITRIAVDRYVIERQLANRALAFSWHGVEWGQREGRIWGRSATSAREKLRDVVMRRCVVSSLATEADIADAVRRLVRFDPHYLYGYASLISTLAPALEGDRAALQSLRAIVCTAEPLHEFEQRTIESRFSVPVVREYGCTETDMIAFECTHRRYHVFVDRCLVEVERSLDGTDCILVTDLDNTLCPILRYRVGDELSLEEGRCDCGLEWPRIGHLVGRLSNRFIVLPENRRVHAVTIAHLVEHTVELGHSIKAFQARQRTVDRLELTLEGVSLSEKSVIESIARAWIAEKVSRSISVDLTFGPVSRSPGRKLHYFLPLVDSSVDEDRTYLP